MGKKHFKFIFICFSLLLRLALINTIPPAYAKEPNSLNDNKIQSSAKNDASVEVVSVLGMVQSQKANSAEWTAVAIGTKLFSQDKIRTLIDSLAQLKYPDNTTLTLRENSLLTIQDISTDPKTGLSKRELKLSLGGMKYKVSKLDEKKSEFKIHSSTAIVGITGTEGSIKTEGDGKPTFNTLVEGATYNTDENGNNGRPLNPGNTWEIDDAAKTGKHMATDDEKNDSAYKGTDPATEKRFNDFMADFNLKMGQGYSMEPLLKIKEGLLSAFIQKDIAKLNSFLDEAEKIIASLKIPGGEEAREVNEIIQAVYKETAAKQKDGFNLTEVFTLLSKAESYYQQEKYAEARDIAAQAKSTLQTLEKKADDFPARLEQFMNELNSKAKAGFMVNEIVETTKQCKIAYAGANRGQAEELLAKAREMLAGARRIIPGELLKDLETLKNEIAGVKNDGFDVADLENLLEQANKAKEAEECFKLEKIIKQLREKIAQGITKTIPPDLLILFNTFEETLKKKEEAGFDLTGLQNLLKTVYEDKKKGDLISLRKSLTQARDALLKLTPPEQLLKHLQDFKDTLKNKKDAGYPVKEIEDLLVQIQSALDKGLIIEARNLLIKAEELLPNLKDTRPPALQAADLEWTDGDKTVRVNGIAKDNIQIAWVSVNGNLVSLSNSGSFSSELLFTPSLKEIVIEAADTSNNLAPEIRIPIPIDKLAGLEKPTDTTPPELKAEDIRLTYIMPDQLKIDGKTESSAIVIINSDKEVIADARGLFTTQITATAELLTLGLSLVSRDAGGNASSAVNVKVEDKWPPVPGVINKVELYDTIPPALQVNGLIYDKSKIKVSGTAQDVANIIVAWTGTFDFGGLKEYTVNGKSVELNTGCTLPLTNELKSVEVCAIDQAGNKSCISRSVDVASSSVKVTLNEQEVSVDQNGKFSAEIISDANLHELVVRASDSVGNQATPATLVVADTIPPFFNLGDVRYAVDSVEISGSSEPNLKIYDKTQKLFTEQITADANGIFKTKFKRPASEISGQLVAEDLSGNVSAPIELTIKPPLDEKPPLLTVANLNYKDNLIIVSGSAEDDTGIRSLTINGREAELNNGLFVKELGLSPDLFKIEVAATDLSGKTTTVVRVVSDNINPEISIGDLEYTAGYCLVKGTASDNIGLKEVRVNSVPVDIKLPEGGSFEYRLPITADLKNVQAFAIDLYGNYAESALKTITLPADTTPPTLTLNEITYGSPLAIVSGIVEDNTGIKAVLINGSPVNFYEDGTFKVQLPIQFGMPVLSLNDAVYAEGLVKVSGKVSLGMQDPREINAQAEDLAGNKSDNLKKPVQAVALQDLKVTVNDAAVDLQNGSFSIEVPIEKGMTGIKVMAADPYGNNSGAVNVALEKIPPLIKVNDPVYNADSVTISGIATDSGSGISEVLINGAAVALGNDGKFSQTLTIAESTVTVAGIDRLGNMATAPPVKLSPPDKNPPVFILKAMPLPAILGKNVFISIEVLDSKTRLPKILPKAPELKVTLPNGESRNLTVNGAGASFNASLETVGLTAGTINISIKGTDSAGNSGDKNEGISSFLLNAADNIPPALKIMVSPLSPVAAGSNIIIAVSASETLKTLPKTEIILPGGNKFEVFLEGPLSETTFSKSIALPADLPPGEALIRAQNAVDLGGNTQSAAAEFSFMVRPAAAIGGTDLILQIKSQEFTADKVSIRGLTAANAIVHINAGNMKMDIPADANGRFSFVQTVTREDLEALSKFSSAGFIDLNCYATNYSGAKSQIYSTKLPLPQITAGGAQQGILNIEIQPEQLEQGKSANIIIRSQINLSQPPRALVKLRNGETEPLILNGAGKEFNAIYQARLNSFPGPALIEARADTYFQTKAFMIIPSGIIMGAGFYGILANPDPGLLGKEIEFTINTQRPAEKAPRLSIRLTNGKVENISLSGRGTEFKGKYLCPANIPPGPSELIINDGEFRRPYGLSSTPSFGTGGETIYRDVAIYSNPAPMMTGSMAAITVRSGQLFNFIPRTDLRLANGRLIPVPLAGAIPGNNFSGTVNLPMDAPYGPAFIVLKNERNEIIAEHPTNIAPTYTLGPSGDKETEATMMPFSAMPGQTVIININSKRQAFIAMPQAKLIFSNNLILPLRLEGAIPSSMLRSSIVLPAVPPGPVSIAIFDETGKPIGGGAGMITGGMAGPASGDLTINIMPPRPILGNPIDVMISSPAFPLYRLPRVALDTGKGPKELRVDGAIPGNTFRAAAILPKDSAPNSEVRVYFDRGAGEETRVMPLNFEFAGGASEAPWPAVITNPDYPVPMQSLMITAHTSSFIDTAPIARVNYIDNSNEIITMFGAGDTFTGTLAFARLPVKSIEVMDSTGRIRSAKTFAGQNVPIPITGPLPIYPWPVMPGVTETINIDLPMPMPGIPKLSLQLPNGQTIPIFLNGGGTHFSGVFVVPPGTPYGEARLTIEVMGQIFTNFPPIPIGTGFSAGPSNPLQLRLTPGAAGELIVDWNMLANAEKHRITYSPLIAPGNVKTIDVGRISHFLISGLNPCTEYLVSLSARDAKGNEIAKEEDRKNAGGVCGGTFTVRASPAGPDGLQLNWDPQPDVNSYELHYALNADPMSGQLRALGNTAAYMLTGLAGGNYRIVIEAVRFTGERLKSQEVLGTVGTTTAGAGALIVTPMPPIINQPLNINLQTILPQFSIPYLRFFFSDGEMREFALNGGLPGTAFNYNYAMLPKYVNRIEAWDNARINKLAPDWNGYGGFGPGPASGSINVTPEPPRAGQTVMVTFTSNMPLALQPYARFFFSDNRPPYEVLMFGQPGGSTYTYNYPNAPADIVGIEIWKNDKTGSFLVDRRYGPGSTAAAGLTFTISLNPNPPVMGTNVNIMLMASQPVDFTAQGLRLYAHFNTGAEKNLPVTPASGMFSSFNASLSPAEHNQPIQFLEVRGPNGPLPYEYRAGQATSGPNSGCWQLTVTPPNSAPATPITITLNNTCGQVLNTAAYIRVYYPSGKILERMLTGVTPGNLFSYFVSAAENTETPVRIEAWDNARTTKLVEVVPGGYYGGSTMTGTMTVTPAPPILGKPLTISASGLLPQQSLPYVIIHYRNFTVSEFPMAGIPGGTNFTFVTSPLTNEIEFIEIKDYTRTIRLTPDRNFNSYTSVVFGGMLNVTPDPPLAGAALNINFQPAGAQVMQPYTRFFFTDGTMQEFLMYGLPAGPAYTFGIPALTKSLARIEIWDNNKTNKLIEKLFTSGGSECWQLSFSSDAPALALSWTVNLNNPCGSPLSVPPAHIHVYFSSGPNLEKIFNLNQVTPASFSYTLSAAEMMYSPTKVVAHESTQRFLTEKTVSSATSNNICDYLHFELRPYPPAIGESVTCVVDIPTTQPFLDIRPIVNMRYIDGTTEYVTLTSGALPGWNFQGNTVFRNQLQGVDVNIPGKTVCTQAPPTSSDWPNYTIPDASPYPLTPGTAVNFYVNFQYPVPAKPNIIATLYNSTGSVLDNFDLIVTGNTPGQFFTGSMAADKWRPGTAKIRIEVENDQFRLLPISREFNINMDYPTGVWEEATAVSTERKIHWNTVPNASGYTIHYGTDAAATLFNKDINNGYTNTDILTGLTSGTVYYYKVTTLGSETSSGIFSFTAGSSVVLDHFYLSAYASLPVNTAATLVVAAKNAANSTIASYLPPSGAVTISYSGVSVTGQTTSLTTANFSLGSAEIHFTPTATGTLQITVSDGNKTSSFTYTVTAATVNHFTLATVPGGVTTRGVGSPVLVKATAYSSADDTTIAAGFNSSAALNVSGSNALISLTDRVTKSTSQLQITSGIGYFTADAFKDGPVSIAVSGYASNTLSISFTAPTSSELTAKQIAAEYQSQAVTDSDGSSITVFMLNSEGKTDPNYTGTITIAITEGTNDSSSTLTKTQGAGSFSGSSPNYSYTFAAADKGSASFQLTDTLMESASFNISAAPLVPASGSIYFTGVQKFIVEPVNPLVRGNSIVLTAWAATNSGRKITSYNASNIPLTNVQEIGGSSLNSKAVPPYINFANGKAAFTISDTEYEQVKFTINGASTPKSDEITVSFADNSDTSAPVLESVVADTPYLLHLYFSEEIDPANALRKDNYSNVGTINKVCWYGNDVTLHLAAALSGTVSLTVEGTDATGIKDIHGNYMGDKTTSNIAVPSNSQGAPYGSGDWLEIQVAPPAVATGTQTVHVTVIQKNACGYLTGSNAINRSTDVGNLSIARGGAYQEKISAPSSSSLSGGQVSFDVTTAFDAAGQSATITVSASGVSSGTATISCSGS